MSRNRFAAIAATIIVSLAATSISALSQNKGLIPEKALSLDMAMKIADATLAKCRSEGYHISVHVMDRTGVDKAALRDEGSSPVNFEVSRRKGYTALMFGRPSADMQKNWAHFPAASAIPGGVIGLAGGIPIQVGDETIGAIGVSGAPGGDKDAACAAAGLAAVADQLK